MLKLFGCISLISLIVNAQAVISLGSGTASKGGSVALSLSLATSSASQSGALEWTLSYSAADVTSVNLTAGSALTAAGKTLSCSSGSGYATCVAYGVNQNAISNGTIASATLNVSSSAPDSSISVALNPVVISNPAGSTISASGSGGSISLTSTLTGLTCASGSVAGPASDSCTVSLSAPAPSGGVAVALSSNNASVTVPASVTVASGSSSATFTAMAAAVTSAQSVTLTASASGAAKTFALTVTPPSTWTVSGSAGVGGATVTLSGAATATTTANSSGAYSFASLANGSYTVTPSMAGVSFTPASQTIAVSGSNVTVPSFTAQAIPSPVTADVVVSQNHPSGLTVTSPQFSTSFANELLLAFISEGGSEATNVTSVSGAGLTWVLVGRTNVQAGSAEIWRAFSPAVLTKTEITASLASSVPATMVVMSFSGVDTTGTNGSGAIGGIVGADSSGAAASATLTTTRENSLVIGVADDTRSEATRTAGSGQTIVHHYMVTKGGTFWVQERTTPSPAAGYAATINDTAPTGDPFNLEICEILPALPALPALETIRSPLVTPVSKTEPVAGAAAGITASAVLSDPVTGVAADACSPGGLASLTGNGLVNAAPEAGNASPLPTRLAGASVRVNGQPSPLLFASGSRINFQCPALAPGTPLAITVDGGSANAQVGSTMREAAPVIFTMNGPKSGAIVIAKSGELVGLTNDTPRTARAGETLAIYASGLGQTAEMIPAGTPAPSDRTIAVNHRIQVVVGDVEVDPSFAGLAPGTVGVFQVNVQLPGNSPIGPEVPISLRVQLSDGTAVSSNEVTIPIGKMQSPVVALNQ